MDKNSKNKKGKVLNDNKKNQYQIIQKIQSKIKKII
jgi:hypothetical protein